MLEETKHVFDEESEDCRECNKLELCKLFNGDFVLKTCTALSELMQPIADKINESNIEDKENALYLSIMLASTYFVEAAYNLGGLRMMTRIVEDCQDFARMIYHDDMQATTMSLKSLSDLLGKGGLPHKN